MCCRIRKFIGDSPFRCKKRFSTKGFTSPFEIYGRSSDLQKLFKEEIWQRGTLLQFTEDEKTLPMDYADPDLESENDVKRRVAEARNIRQQGRDATPGARQETAESASSSTVAEGKDIRQRGRDVTSREGQETAESASSS
jgi:hypothetical protein